MKPSRWRMFAFGVLLFSLAYGIGQGCSPRKSQQPASSSTNPTPDPTDCGNPLQLSLEVSYVGVSFNPASPRQTLMVTDDQMARFDYGFSPYLGRYFNWPVGQNPPSAVCGNPPLENPGTIKMWVHASRPLVGCFIKNSPDDTNWFPCQTAHVDLLNSGAMIRLNVDDVRPVDVPGDAYGSCVYTGASPVRLSLGNTSTFQLRAIDGCGTEALRQFAYTWTIKTVPP